MRIFRFSIKKCHNPGGDWHGKLNPSENPNALIWRGEQHFPLSNGTGTLYGKGKHGV